MGPTCVGGDQVEAADPTVKALAEVRDLLIQRMSAALSDPDAPPSAALMTAIARILRECGALRPENGGPSPGAEATSEAPLDDAPDFGPLAEEEDPRDADPDLSDLASEGADDVAPSSAP